MLTAWLGRREANTAYSAAVAPNHRGVRRVRVSIDARGGACPPRALPIYIARPATAPTVLVGERVRRRIFMALWTMGNCPLHLRTVTAQNVRGLVNKLKMFMTNAVAHSAQVIGDHISRFLSTNEFQGEYVGTDSLSIHKKRTVAISEPACVPQPAGIRLLDFAPKPFCVADPSGSRHKGG